MPVGAPGVVGPDGAGHQVQRHERQADEYGLVAPVVDDARGRQLLGDLLAAPVDEHHEQGAQPHQHHETYQVGVDVPLEERNLRAHGNRVGSFCEVDGLHHADGVREEGADERRPLEAQEALILSGREVERRSRDVEQQCYEKELAGIGNGQRRVDELTGTDDGRLLEREFRVEQHVAAAVGEKRDGRKNRIHHRRVGRGELVLDQEQDCESEGDHEGRVGDARAGHVELNPAALQRRHQLGDLLARRHGEGRQPHHDHGCRQDEGARRLVLAAPLEDEVDDHDAPREKEQRFVEIRPRRLRPARNRPAHQHARGVHGRTDPGQEAADVGGQLGIADQVRDVEHETEHVDERCAAEQRVGELKAR